MKFRKRPVVVDAIRYEEGTQTKILSFLLDGKKDYMHLPMCRLDGKHGVSIAVSDGTFRIPTKDGIAICRVGDWIIKNGKGEFYPIKDEMFKETYELIDHSTHTMSVADCHECHMEAYSMHEGTKC